MHLITLNIDEYVISLFVPTDYFSTCILNACLHHIFMLWVLHTNG